MKQLTIRNVPEDLARALSDEKRRQGRSLNRVVLDLLRKAVGLAPDSRYDNGLGGLAGTWTQEEHSEFEKATSVFEQIDEELWV